MVVTCPDLHSTDLRAGPDPQTASRHERVIAAVTGFCPDVEVVAPGVCAFGARGPARYFGGETALAARITAALADLGEESRAGVADGLFAALLAARDGQNVPPGGTARFLAAQPVSVLARRDLAGQDLAAQDLVALLVRLGLRTLGDFAALPARDVASRFGDAGEGAHRLARGLDPRPLVARPPSPDLSVAQEFDPPEPRAEPVVFAAKALAGRLHDGLAARGLTCVRVQVSATWADGRESSRRWRHDGLLSAAAIAERVRWQLDGTQPAFTGEENAQGGIVALQLLPDQVVRATGQQLALWGETLVSDRVARAAMRVQAMLGHEAVLRPVVGGGRNVHDQVTPVPFGEKTEPRLPGGRPWPGRVRGTAPGLVFPSAREAEVTDDAGRAVTVSGRCAVSAAPARLAVRGEPPRRVTGWAGPWPLSERWWDPSAARRRARFQLATEDGRAWLAVLQDGRWLVEAGYWLGELGQSAGLLARAAAPDVLGDRERAIQTAEQAPASRAAASRDDTLGRTALPLLVQLPGRRGHPRRAGRRGGPARARGARPHRPRRDVRGAAVRAGRAAARRPGRHEAGHGLRRRAQHRTVQRPERRTRPGRPPPAHPGPGRRRLPAAVRRDQRRAAGRRRERPPGLRHR
jgi:protein ImuB